MKVYCKKSYIIVAGELFTKGKWYRPIFDWMEDVDHCVDIQGNNLGNIDIGGSPLDSMLFYKGYGYFGFHEYFYTEQQYERIQKLKKLNESSL